MDVRFFLGERLAFIAQLYSNSAAPFIERKRKIEAEEDPFVPPYSEDPEPAFLEEWLEAKESHQVIGQMCISMLSATFHLYFKTWERQLGVHVDSSFKSAFKRGWFNGYKEYFLRQFGVNFENSPCNLSLLEELVLARNRVQHPESITDQGSQYSENDLKKIPSPFFVDDRDFELLADMDEGERSWLVPPTIHVTSEKLSAAISEVTRFAEWLEQSEQTVDPRRVPVPTNYKTYALLDLIGISAAIEAGEAAGILERFWNSADAWTNSQSFPAVSIPGKGCRATPDVYVSTFSDSALLYTETELEIDDFLNIVRDFKRCIERNACNSYVVISRNAEIAQPEIPALGGRMFGANGRPRYTSLAGSGSAWINLHRADFALKNRKDWHSQYSIYCVGEQSCPTNCAAKESVECPGLIEANHIFAIE